MKPALLLASIFLIVHFTGCASSPGRDLAEPDLLDFLKVGQTDKRSVILTLGEPSGAFDSDSILAYRIGFESNIGYFRSDRYGGPNWSGLGYSLILVFDETGILQEMNLVQVR